MFGIKKEPEQQTLIITLEEVFERWDLTNALLLRIAQALETKRGG